MAQERGLLTCGVNHLAFTMLNDARPERSEGLPQDFLLAVPSRWSQKALGGKQKAENVFSAYCFLPIAFCFQQWSTTAFVPLTAAGQSRLIRVPSFS